MTIVTLGCSFTDHYHRDVNPWPKVIEKRTGIQVVNYGWCGSGNKYSFDALINHLKQGKEVDTVYWLMTEFDRMDTIGLWRPKLPGPFFSLRPYPTGKDPEGFLNRWNMDRTERSSKPDLKINSEIEDKDLQRIKREIRLGRIMYQNISQTEFFDYNLMLVHLIQKVCKDYNINLKIMSALRPLYTNDLKEMSFILKSKYVKKIDFSSVIGFPFYKDAGGICAGDIEDWNKKYSISSTDNHPNQLGSDLLADFFLGEKNILDYR